MPQPIYQASLPQRFADAIQGIIVAIGSLERARDLEAFAEMDPRHQKLTRGLITNLVRHKRHLHFLHMESTKAVLALQSKQPELMPSDDNTQPHLL